MNKARESILALCAHEVKGLINSMQSASTSQLGQLCLCSMHARPIIPSSCKSSKKSSIFQRTNNIFLS